MTRQDGHPDQEGAPQAGSLAEETARLLGALSGWAREHGADVGHGAGGLADHLVEQVTAAAHDVDEHLATGGPECTVCPICRTVHAVRQLSPEVKEHLAVAASSLVQAVAGVLATVVPDPAEGGGAPDVPTDDATDAAGGTTHVGGGRDARVERIVLDEDLYEEDS